MYQLRRILQLRQQGYSKRAIAATLALARSTVDQYLATIESHFDSLDQALNWQDDQLHRLLAQPLTPKADRIGDLYERFPSFDAQLSKPGVTRFHLWSLYKQHNPDGLQYTQFCWRYQQWLQTQRTVMHIEHKAGDKLFVDFAGKRLTVIDATTNQPLTYEFFVAILGCSQLTYAVAMNSQRKEDFLAGLGNSLIFMGGVPAAIVPDNLKAAVQTANRYEPDLNETIQDFAAHYGTCIYPTRSRKPRDKALVEGAVNILYQRVYTALQDKPFHSLQELNQQIMHLVEAHNQQLFQGKTYSRRQRFETLEAAQLRPLPADSYELKEYRLAKVQVNSHVLLQPDKHYYSVPYRFVGQQLKLVYTQHTVEMYHQHERIAFHARCRLAYGYSTQPGHLPPQQQWVSQWSADFFRQQALQAGPWLARAIEQVLKRLEEPLHAYPQQVYRSCAGILSLVKKVEPDRLEKACERALYYGSVSYKILRGILDSELDRLPLPQTPTTTIPAHENIRGATAYQ
ncbi:IS21-like element ISPsy14 family transposase [Nibrella saemangeumensis]|uniref:IS21-like element ISPsy14 family transposase n=1 Tax=Nibrella saemangeumensis TaxID=1084526 RepID=A0ABP8N4V4_9BACT